MPTPVVDSMKVYPFGFDIGTTENVPLSFDTTPWLVGGQTPDTPIVVLIEDIVTDDVIDVSAAIPTIVGNKIIQQVNGSLLTPGHTYQMLVTFTTSDSAATLTMVQELICER